MIKNVFEYNSTKFHFKPSAFWVLLSAFRHGGMLAPEQRRLGAGCNFPPTTPHWQLYGRQPFIAWEL